MSERLLTRVGWVLVVVSGCCGAALQLAMNNLLEQWNGLPFALLLHGALLTAVVAVGLTHRRGSATLRAIATLLAVLLMLAWLRTWLVPLQDLVGWARLAFYCWLGF